MPAKAMPEFVMQSFNRVERRTLVTPLALLNKLYNESLITGTLDAKKALYMIAAACSEMQLANGKRVLRSGDFQEFFNEMADRMDSSEEK